MRRWEVVGGVNSNTSCPRRVNGSTNVEIAATIVSIIKESAGRLALKNTRLLRTT